MSQGFSRDVSILARWRMWGRDTRFWRSTSFYWWVRIVGTFPVRRVIEVTVVMLIVHVIPISVAMAGRRGSAIGRVAIETAVVRSVCVWPVCIRVRVRVAVGFAVAAAWERTVRAVIVGVIIGRPDVIWFFWALLEN